MNSTKAMGFKSGLDVIRVIAISFVVAAHFFLNSDFKSTPFDGCSILVQGVERECFYVIILP